MRAFLIAFLLLLWLILGWLFYRDHSRCCSGERDVSAVPVITQKTGPLLFAYNNATPITGDSWLRLRDSVSLFATDTSSLEIIGWYCTNLNPAETGQLALQRANAVRLLFPDIPDDRISIVTKAMEYDSTRMSINDVAAAFASRVRTANIQEIEDRTLIYFPFNSTKKLNNTAVESYLKNVAERVIKSGESVVLTGHTDNIGSDESNLALGQQRADIIKQYLVSLGVPSAKITATSKGKAMPVADNQTEEGRAKNRRTELQIIK